MSLLVPTHVAISAAEVDYIRHSSSSSIHTSHASFSILAGRGGIMVIQVPLISICLIFTIEPLFNIFHKFKFSINEHELIYFE